MKPNEQLVCKAQKSAAVILSVIKQLIKDERDFLVITLDSCHYCTKLDWLISLIITNHLKPNTSSQQMLRGVFLTISTRPLHRITEKHAFLAVDPSYVKLMHSVHVACFDINQLTAVEVEHFIKVYTGCQYVQTHLVYFLHRITGGSIGILKSVFDELSECNEIISKKSTCRLTRHQTRDSKGYKIMSIPPKTKRIFSKVIDQLSMSSKLFLKCAVSISSFFEFRAF